MLMEIKNDGANLDCGTLPGWPGVRTEHLEPRQKSSVLFPEGEAIPPEPCQLHKSEIKNCSKASSREEIFENMRPCKMQVGENFEMIWMVGHETRDTYPRYLIWCWTRVMSNTRDRRLSLGLMQRTNWQCLLVRLLRRAPMDILNWVPTVAGRRRRVLLELPNMKNERMQTIFSLFLTFRKEDAEKWMICLVHYAG